MTTSKTRVAFRYRLAAKAVTTLLAGMTSIAASAQTVPAPEPAPNMLTWPLPDTLSPEGKATAAAMAKMPISASLPPIAAQRQMMSAMQDVMGAQMRKKYDVHIENSTIAGVPVRIVYPKGMTALGAGPVLLNLHGGGFLTDSGSLTETIPIAALTGLPVVAVLYRLAPENPYPAALDDALAVYQALEKDRKASQIAVYGTSAGAVLGAELIAQLTAMKRPMPAALGFFSGSADMSTSGDSESWMPLPGGYKTLAAAISGYIGKTEASDPVLSPIHGDLSGFPPTLLMSSTRDVLLSGTSIFARALLEQGVDAPLVVFDGLPHAFWGYLDIPETTQAHVLMANFLKRHVPAR